MRVFLILVGGLIVGAVLLRAFLRTQPAALARRIRIAGGIALVVSGIGLLFLSQFALALTLGTAGFLLLRREAAMRTAAPDDGGTSSVRSAGLEMSLDHASGEMDGVVLAGRHEGKRLKALTLVELIELAEDFRGDAESLRLLESYLDRTHPGWREHVEADAAGRQRAAPRAAGMSTQEAYQILGLEPGASRTDVREAHRRLMKQFHPDRGGSAALAAKINEAKERIIGRHG